MEKIKTQVIKEILKKRNDVKELYLLKGYDKAVDDIMQVLKEELIEDNYNKPSSLDLIIDLDLIEDKNRKSISKENAVKLFYYKLGWDRGSSRMADSNFNNNELLLKKIV
ncbi:hypothetical protein [Pseudofulvibacter geojedonensis]|uniref:Uncharacterized protein n=1 Tax=Pseudofulvibacter geojedonensis TaxID=1123758 RepID=A0ABW3I2A2_9FLAO